MRRILIFLLALIFQDAPAQTTRFEQSAGKETATYFEAVKWYQDLALHSPMIKIRTMGETDAGYPLHLVLISTGKDFDPVKWHQQKKIVILVNNGIHPGEPDGIDASMMLVRDIIQNKTVLPANVVLAFIPVYNIGGCLNRNAYTRANQNGPESYGFRGSAQNLDLNRDFIKCDSKEARAFAAIFQLLDPDIFVDNHVSDGADYQHTMTLISTQYDKLGPVLGKFLKDKFEPALYDGMAKKSWELIPYVDFETNNFDKGMRMFYDPPRYSSGYAALFSTLSFMPETHMLKPYKQRVQSTYDLLRTFIEKASLYANELLEARKVAKQSVIEQQTFALRWIPDTSFSRQIIFKGYERDSALSEATGLQKMFYNHNKPFTRQIRYFDQYKPADLVTKPTAFVIPHGWNAVIDILRLNNVKVGQLKNDSDISVNTMMIENYKSYSTAYEKHHKNYNVTVRSSKKTMHFLKGDYIIYANQVANRYLVETLDPRGDDSFFAWNFFDAILQQKEGYSDYRWEEIAAEVLKTTPELKAKLDEKKLSDPVFANNSKAILEFIYKNSVYFEKAYMQYPVYSID